MKRVSVLIGLVLLGCAALAQQDEKPERLSVHTWVREDVFAGFMVNDMARFEKGVAKLERHLAKNPEEASALAWLGGTELYRAVLAKEAGRGSEQESRYRKAMELFERAYTLSPKDQGVLATTGGSLVLFADRLPPSQKTEGWKMAQSRFSELEAMQAPMLDKLPLHMRGELLAGVAMSAQRTGDEERSKTYLARIVKDLPGTPYEARAKKWIEQPELAARGSLACQTCHESGRLENRLAAMQKQK